MNERVIDNDILNESKTPLITRYFFMLLSLFISALLYNFLLQPTKIVTGGVPGLAIINQYINGVAPSITIAVISTIMIILSYIYLGKKHTNGTLIATITYPILVQITSNLTKYYTFDISDLLVISIFIGVIGGLSNGILYKTGFSNGGLPIISQILFKYYGIPIGRTSFIINGAVILLGGIYFGTTMIMYALIVIFINSIVVDKVLMKEAEGKAIYIVTKEKKKVKKFLIEDMHHTATVFDTKGAFLKKNKELILTVIPTREYFQITESIKLLDPDVFYVVNNAHEIRGGR